MTTSSEPQRPGLTVDLAGSVEPLADPDEPRSALVLTEGEWADLAEICKLFLSEYTTPKSLGLPDSPGGEERWVSTDRKRALARRVVDACDDSDLDPTVNGGVDGPQPR